MKTLRLSKKSVKAAKSGSFGAYIRLSSRRGVKVFCETRAVEQYGLDLFQDRVAMVNSSYYETVEAEFETMRKAHARLGDRMPKPIELVEVKVGSEWYMGIIMTHVVGKTLGAMLDRVLTQNGTDYESEDLYSLDDFQTYFENDSKLTALISRYMDLIQDARDQGVSMRDDHPWNVMYDSKRDKLVLIDFSPNFVDFPDTSTDAVLDQCFE